MHLFFICSFNDFIKKNEDKTDSIGKMAGEYLNLTKVEGSIRGLIKANIPKNGCEKTLKFCQDSRFSVRN